MKDSRLSLYQIQKAVLCKKEAELISKNEIRALMVCIT